MASVLPDCVSVHSGTVLLSSSPALASNFKKKEKKKKSSLYGQKEASSGGHPDLMQCAITENTAPSPPLRLWVQTHWPQRRGYMMIARVQSEFFFFLRFHHIWYHIRASTGMTSPCAEPCGSRHERRGACFMVWFTLGQMARIVEDGNWRVSM